ncbi:hypothetical protein FAZ19_01190 [Sphingobacterium alkalisoli]|uniref:RHS repeat-associated core domain-containing protein n=1 Tax=Sphingobacterium alkalisoli TaxID=1874115 RepID=A0A4V5LYV9_9SPHI|nr:DUF6443 domain-containing protein [Sphingobacterium alkalisoli]TJY67909.1 hypothetical protein FAZ19_01190 [Sphingobacterium alkalisoli]GGH10501.1 hypothetical protein GCM10011418_08900 [Sphingobacterium alkalisoli]
MKENLFTYIIKLLWLLPFLLANAVYGQSHTPPNISYSIPPALTVGTYVNYSPDNTGGAIHRDGYVGRIAGNTSVPQGTSMTGPATGAGIGEVSAMTSDGQGGLYLFDWSMYRMYHISESGQISFFAGDGVDRVQNGTGASASFGVVVGMATDGLGNIYFCEYDYHVIRKITPSGVVSTIAGSVGQSGYADGQGSSARFERPAGIAVDGAGNLYVRDSENARVRKITPSGMVSTLAGNGSFSSIDGPAATASLDLSSLVRANGIAVDANGNVYVSETYKGLIRKITPDGTVSTYAGLRQGASGAPRSGPALTIRLEDPASLAINRTTGDLYVVSSIDGIVTQINAGTGMATTVVGGGSMQVQEGAPLEVGYSWAEGLLCLEDGSLVIEDLGSAGRSTLYRHETKAFSIDPALPAGLKFDARGNISGRALLTSPQTNYTITAHNAWGSHDYTASFAVELPLGGAPGLHTGPPDQIAATLSQNFIEETTIKVPGLTVLVSHLDVGQADRSIVYYDGLGRPIQTVHWQGSPNKKDIVQHIEYDRYGREVIKYLPYAEYSGSNGAYRGTAKASQQTFYSSMGWDADVHKTAYPYAHTAYELNPMTNRPLQQGAAGASWQPSSPSVAGSGHTVAMEYGTNVADEVRLWRINPAGNGANGSEHYEAGKLYKTVIKDENWVSANGKAGTVEEFRDFQDRVVLKRIWKSTEALNTYYVYDILGSLRYVIPPGYTTSTVTDNNVDFNEMVYAYRYDTRKRLIEKKIPGKGWEYLIYNKVDQVILSQDANQRAVKKWSYSKYDAFGRTTSTGIYTNTTTNQSTRAQVQTLANAVAPQWENRLGTTNYTNTTFPNTPSQLQELTVSYYDDYSFAGASTSTLQPSGITKSDKTQTLLTGMKVSRDDGTAPLLTVNYYDDRAQLIQSVSQNHLGGTDRITNEYTFVGELTKSTHVHIAKGVTTTMVTTNSYDHVGRLLASKHYINDPLKEVTRAKNEYNEIGQLKKRSVGGDKNGANYHTTVDYAYNERGWTTGASSPQFTYQLNYDRNSTGTILSNAQYNGNIAQQLWGHGPTTNSTFAYSYDKLNRLTNGTSTGTTVMIEALTYDDMGNIKTLARNTGNTTATTSTTYTYNNGNKSNRLASLSGNTNTYLYDANGNATKDRTGMTIRYNHLNLPDSVYNASVRVGYLYDAMGTKLRKYSNQGGNRDYVGGVEYNGNNIELIHMGEGVAYRNTSNNTYTYRYNLTDHLGNVRSTVYRNPTTNAIEVLQKDDYYPFGKQRVVAAGNNKYLYNGKEIQGELGGQYDYGARFYDAEIGRWNVPDPLAEVFYNVSPYNYGMNNPILMVDPTGMAADTTINTSVSAVMGKNNILSVTQTTTTTIVDKNDRGTTTTKIVSSATDRVSSDPDKDTERGDVITTRVTSHMDKSGKGKILDKSGSRESRDQTKVDTDPLRQVTNSLENFRNINGEQFVSNINRYGTNATSIAGAGAAAPFGTASLIGQLINSILGKGTVSASGLSAVLPSLGISTSNYGVSRYISTFGIGNEKIMLIKHNNVERFRYLK